MILLFLAGCINYGGGAANFSARSYLVRGEPSGVNYGAYGYLLFTQRPSEPTSQRYRLICEAFHRNLESVQELKGFAANRLAVTFWLLDGTWQSGVGEEAIEYAGGDCDLDLRYYDYATAHVIGSSIEMASVRGPVLVAFDKEFGQATARNDSLILDMSDFSDEDLDRAFRIWKERIVKDSDVWNEGMNFVRWREAFRSFIQEYGAGIVTFVTGG